MLNDSRRDSQKLIRAYESTSKGSYFLAPVFRALCGNEPRFGPVNLRKLCSAAYQAVAYSESACCGTLETGGVE